MTPCNRAQVIMPHDRVALHRTSSDMLTEKITADSYRMGHECACVRVSVYEPQSRGGGVSATHIHLPLDPGTPATWQHGPAKIQPPVNPPWPLSRHTQTPWLQLMDGSVWMRARPHPPLASLQGSRVELGRATTCVCSLASSLPLCKGDN